MSFTKQIKYKDSGGNEQLIDIGVDAKNVDSNTFSQAAARANLASGENLPTVFGKLMKWFADLKTVAWTGSYNDLTNKPTMGGITGTVAVTQGGTGATTASQARINLGVGVAGTNGVANNCTTTAVGYALDARQGKALMDKANQISSDLATAKSNFQAGCSTIAAAITSMGVSTASNAAPATMAANIKKIKNATSGSFSASAESKKIVCGFRPSMVVIVNGNTGRRDVLVYDSRISTTNVYIGYSNCSVLFADPGQVYEYPSPTGFAIANDGFTFTNYVAYSGDIMYWFACK